MSFSTFKMAVVPPLPPKRSEPTCAALPLQVRNEEKPYPIKTISRRDVALCLTTSTLAGSDIFKPEPVEARVVKPETRKKIFEKLKLLRENAGLSKQKAENGETTIPPQKESISKGEGGSSKSPMN